MFNVLILTIWFLVSLVPIPSGILPVEREIAGSPVECAAGFVDGKMVFSFCGDDPGKVTPNKQQTDLVAWKGVYTHNHPEGGCWMLSPQDVYQAEQFQLLEIRVVSIRKGRLRVSSMRRIGSTFSYIPDADIQAEARRQLTIDATDPCDYLSRTWVVLAPQFGLKYTVIE